MSPPDAPDGSTASPTPAGVDAGIRMRLRRLGAAGTARRAAHPPGPDRAAAPLIPRPTPARPASAAGDGVEVVRARYSLAHRHGHSAIGESLDAIAAHGEEIDPGRTVWLDTETTGLAGGTGTYVFLVGLASLGEGGIVIEQFLLRRLSAEGRFLAMLQERLARARRLVTFNGQRFDWPLLEARFVLARLRPTPVDAHTDLIHSARRLWHRVLGTHRLSAIEAAVLGAPRAGDIQGWEIPQVYVHYLRTADRGALEPVLAHNRTDLVALLGLHAAVARVLSNPPGPHGPIDWEGAGVLLGRRGDHAQAARCFERALDEADRREEWIQGNPFDGRDRWRILRRCVREYRLMGAARRVRERWEKEVSRPPQRDRYHAQALMEVSRAREAALDDRGAGVAAAEALAIARSLDGSRAPCPPLFVERLRRRVARLAAGGRR